MKIIINPIQPAYNKLRRARPSFKAAMNKAKKEQKTPLIGNPNGTREWLA
jgi:hypothetical protein